MTSLCATQPTYFPAVHILARALSVDHLVLLGSAQFSRKTQSPDGAFSTGQNTTRFVAGDGPMRLTIPVQRGRASIDNTRPSGLFGAAHLRSITMGLAKAPHFDELATDLAWLLGRVDGAYLGDINRATWWWALGRLAGIDAAPECMAPANIAAATALVCPLARIDRDVDVVHQRATGSDWMLQLALAAGADRYVGGRTAIAYYLDREAFELAGVTMAVHTFSPVPWKQRHRGRFDPDVSILDLVASVGWDDARRRLLVTGR